MSGRKTKESGAAQLFLSHKKSWASLALILCAALVAMGPLLMRGPSCSSDFAFHYISWIDAERSMSNGTLYPHWANLPNFGAGEPKFVFYPPLPWMGGAVLGMILPWTIVPLVLSFALLAATGLANRALASMALEDGPATLAGCAAIFLTYSLFSIYRRNDFGELAGGFWIPLLLLFTLRRRNPSANFWVRIFDGSTAPLALIIAGIWLTNGPVGIMASYLLTGVALVSALIEKSLVPIVRAGVAAFVGMALASIYLLPAVAERNWISIQDALKGQSAIENNWIFGLHADPRLASDGPQLLGASWVAVAMIVIAFGGGAIAWIRGVVPGERKWWLPLALIPPAVTLLFFPVSLPVWNILPELRLLQFPWRWLVALEAPMAICFASAVWVDRRTQRNPLIAVCAVFFLSISLAAPHWWFRECGSLIDSLQESARENLGVVGKPEYAPPGTRSPLTLFQLDPQGNLQLDPQGNPIAQALPSACLLDTPITPTLQGKGAPAWLGEPNTCKTSGWQELGAARDFPEHKWFMGIAQHAGYVILRLRYFPAWAVKVNGVPATAIAEQDRGLMAVPVPKGNVQITVQWTATQDVVAGRWVSGIAVILMIALLRFERTRLHPLGSPRDSKRSQRPPTQSAPSLTRDSQKTVVG